MSLFFPFFKQQKPRDFEHKPIYYDKRKEEMRDRVKRIKEELELQEKTKDRNDFEKDIRGSFRAAAPKGDFRNKMAKFNKIMIIFMIFLILFIIFVYLWGKF